MSKQSPTPNTQQAAALAKIVKNKHVGNLQIESQLEHTYHVVQLLHNTKHWIANNLLRNYIHYQLTYKQKNNNKFEKLI